LAEAAALVGADHGGSSNRCAIRELREMLMNVSRDCQS